MEDSVETTGTSQPSGAGVDTVSCGLGEFLFYFLRLGTVGFGGPIALVGYMQRDLVEHRRWISSQDYVEGLALSQLSPGPLAAQLAIYLGWVRGRVIGATLVGLAFVLPSFVMVVALAALYLRFDGLSWMQGAFYGVGAAAIAIIARSAVKLLRMTIRNDPLLWSLFAVSALVTALTESEIISVFVLCGVVALMVKAPPRWRPAARAGALVPWPLWMAAGLSGPASAATIWKIGWYFAEAGAFVFGSGLAIVPFLYGGVVAKFHWLNDRQFLDAVAVAMITPGPVVITVAFIGYLAAGPLGAVAASVGVFLPPFMVVVVLAPYMRRLVKNPQVKAFVYGVTAAATGAIAGATFVLGKRAIFDTTTAAIFLVTLLLLNYKKIPEPLLILAAGVAGFVIKRSAGL